MGERRNKLKHDQQTQAGGWLWGNWRAKKSVTLKIQMEILHGWWISLHKVSQSNELQQIQDKGGNRVEDYMGVSENSGTPKSSILIEFSIVNHPFWGTPIFGSTHMWMTIPFKCVCLKIPNTPQEIVQHEIDIFSRKCHGCRGATWSSTGG